MEFIGPDIRLFATSDTVDVVLDLLERNRFVDCQLRLVREAQVAHLQINKVIPDGFDQVVADVHFAGKRLGFVVCSAENIVSNGKTVVRVDDAQSDDCCRARCC